MSESRSSSNSERDRALLLYRHQLSWTQVRLIEVRKGIEKRKAAKSDQEIVVATDAMAIQLRMALESIAFATLVANEAAYTAARPKGINDWHAARILNAISTINPHFYPWPFSVSVLPTGTHLQPADDSFYLTKSKFIDAYDGLGAMLHAPSPLRGTSDYKGRSARIEKWAKLTQNLIANHLVELTGHGFVLANVDTKTGGCTVRLAEPLDGASYVVGDPFQSRK